MVGPCPFVQPIRPIDALVCLFGAHGMGEGWAMDDITYAIATQLPVDPGAQGFWFENLVECARNAEGDWDRFSEDLLGKTGMSGEIEQLKNLVESFGVDPSQALNSLVETNANELTETAAQAYGGEQEGQEGQAGEVDTDPMARWPEFTAQASGTWYGDEDSWPQWVDWAKQTAEYYECLQVLEQVINDAETSGDKRGTLEAWGIGVAGDPNQGQEGEGQEYEGQEGQEDDGQGDGQQEYGQEQGEYEGQEGEGEQYQQ